MGNVKVEGTTYKEKRWILRNVCRNGKICLICLVLNVKELLECSYAGRITRTVRHRVVLGVFENYLRLKHRDDVYRDGTILKDKVANSVGKIDKRPRKKL